MRTDDLYLVDMIEAADGVLSFTAGLDEPRFAANAEKRGAVLWGLFIIGEATTKLSAAIRDSCTGVPWDEIRAFRNRLAHGYFTLDWSIVWQIATTDVPVLRHEADRVLSQLYPDAHRQYQERRGGHGSAS